MTSFNQQLAQAKPNNFKLEIYDPLDSNLKLINFMVQDTNLPGLTLSTSQVPYQNLNLKIQDNKLVYDNLELTIVINDDWTDYKYFTDWMKRCVYSENLVSEMKDINLYLLNNSKVPVKKISFFKAWPTNISSIPLIITTLDTIPLILPVSFSYQAFDVETLI